MQKDLSLATFLQAVQTYAYSLNEISSLDIVAYLHETQRGVADIFHFFSRTRNSPHKFYYRTLTIHRPFNEIFWRPWTKIEMDIPSVETKWDGARLDDTGAYLLPVLIGSRLYIFMPQILAKTLANDAGMTTPTAPTFQGLISEKVSSAQPKRIWEVTMTWTELVKGSWSPKRVSPGSLSVTTSLPSAAQFRVDSFFTGTKLTLLVSHSVLNTKDATKVGAFVFCEDHISVVAGTSVSFNSPATQFSTHFQKASGTVDHMLLATDNDDDDKRSPQF